jgi:hypothetical protein
MSAASTSGLDSVTIFYSLINSVNLSLVTKKEKSLTIGIA